MVSNSSRTCIIIILKTLKITHILHVLHLTFGYFFWSGEEFEVAGFFVFSHIRMMVYSRLGQG